MEIVVIGGGSVGMLIASFLAEYNDRVTLITHTEDQARTLKQNGLVRKNIDGTTTVCRVDAYTDLSYLSKDALVIVAVKYGHLVQVYETLQNLDPAIPLLFLQNGLAHLEEADSLPQLSIAFGSCQFGAERENDVMVHHRGIGVMKIAVEKGDVHPFKLLLESPNSFFQVEFVKSAEEMLFEKAILNCFINPLTAVLNVTNGKLVEDPSCYKLLQNIYKEVLNAFPEEMSRISFSDVVNLCRRTASNTSSMLGDMLKSSPTEIETIVGAVIKRAAKAGRNLPILETLYLLVLAKEGSGEKM
ncbi:ketopantoate reductase family protein [Ureibacillus sinduriensis]|uniref:2-dehydropantoate 2-reductase n=1 Tax=Ureibacillus sinduriensis BLB-1 = JCM 15800 TaxID=1384057 RepID=A0A0A3HMP1_9BACL|nr:2-dehydropantoate 2-reductase [Ureibacillus sinduriensis]KGR73796.1 2-dehydropantoate 2-reductase [Ureibacillus sinduriensis BLB-1 = JCM 15800]